MGYEILTNNYHVAHSPIEGAVSPVKEAGKAVQHPLGPHPHPPPLPPPPPPPPTTFMPSLSPSFPRRLITADSNVDVYSTDISCAPTTTTPLANAAPVASASTSPVSGLHLSNLSVRPPHNPSTMGAYMMSHVFPPVAGSQSGLTSLASVGPTSTSLA